MLVKLLTLQFIAHLLGDFIFQSKKWVEKKESKTFTWVHVWHSLVIFILSYGFSLDLGFWKYAILLTVIHYLTDTLKSCLQVNHEIKENILFFSDQIIHLITIIGISMLYYYKCECNIEFLFDIPIKYLVVASAFIFVTKPVNILIKIILISMKISLDIEGKKTEEKDLPNAGKLIGVMERILVLTLILVGQFSAFGFIITAKSILRFSNTQKNEYVLVGTMLSFGIATIIGVLVSGL